MRKKDLIELRRLFADEINRRDRIKCLLGNDLVKEYLDITNTSSVILDSTNTKEVIEYVLSNFKIISNSHIYVCTNAYYTACYSYYQGDEYYSVHTKIDGEDAESKEYRNIETGLNVHAVREYTSDLEKAMHYPLIEEFEKKKIILNPYNDYRNENGFEEVRLDYFEEAIKNGTNSARKLVLSKYPRI